MQICSDSGRLTGPPLTAGKEVSWRFGGLPVTQVPGLSSTYFKRGGLDNVFLLSCARALSCARRCLYLASPIWWQKNGQSLMFSSILLVWLEKGDQPVSVSNFILLFIPDGLPQLAPQFYHFIPWLHDTISTFVIHKSILPLQNHILFKNSLIQFTRNPAAKIPRKEWR